MKVRFTTHALRQVDGALGYVARQSPQGAARIEARLHELTGLIETYPAAGQSTSRTGIRRLVLTPYPYLVFYRIIDGEVLVMRFRHGARRPVQM